MINKVFRGIKLRISNLKLCLKLNGNLKYLNSNLSFFKQNTTQPNKLMSNSKDINTNEITTKINNFSLEDDLNIKQFKKDNGKPLFVSVQGNIGSGKSTLVENMKQYYRNDPKICFLQEPVDLWNKVTDENGVTILENYYGDQKRWAFSFQIMAYISRLALVRKEMKKDYDIVISERCIYADNHVFAKMLYDEGKINEIDYKIYMMWFNEFTDEFPLDKVIYIRTKPETSEQRVIKRSRQGEAIPLEYLSKCHDYHENWLNSTQNVLTIDGEVDVYDRPDTVNTWINKIEHFCVQ